MSFISPLVLFICICQCECYLLCQHEVSSYNSLECTSIGNSDNVLSSIEHDLSSKITHYLKMSNCRIRSLSSEAFSEIGPIVELDLSHNLLPYLDQSWFKHLPNLLKLDLSSNRIGTVHPEAFKNLRQLQHLDLSNNAIVIHKDEPFFQIESPNLKTLDLSGNCDIDLQLFMKNMNLLEITSIAASRVMVLDDQFKMSETSSISMRQLKSIPEYGLGNLEHLKEFTLTSSKITELPSELSKMCWNLYFVDLSGNELKSLGNNTFAACTNLISLNISHNHLTQLTRFTFSNSLAKLLELDLSYNRILKIEARTFDGLAGLRVLNLAGNKMAVLPYQAFMMNKQLNTLHLDNNELMNFYNNMFEPMKELRTLTVSRNAITNFPSSLVQMLPHLNLLDLNSNKLEKIDTNFGNMRGLKNLGLACNSLVDLPSGIFSGAAGLLLHVHGNPFKCDCVKRFISEMNIGNRSLQIASKHFLDGYTPSCIISGCDEKLPDANSRNTWLQAVHKAGVCVNNIN